MKIVLALDSFKGSLSARAACEAAAEGVRRELPDADLALVPMADGGEGTADAVLRARNGQWRTADVTGPLPGMRVRAGFVWMPNEREALVEMAQASGLPLLSPDQYAPLQTTTFGTGELLRAALDLEPVRVWLAVGGSATVDGGVGAASALGWQFLDAGGNPVSLGGQGLGSIARIHPPPDHAYPPIHVLCDVTNPLCGPNGAARVFGPQKGANAEAVGRLESGLEHLAELVRRQMGVEIDVPGGGAAGGLAAGAIGFLKADTVPGIDAVMSVTGLDRELADADWVLTGEGMLDGQSLQGKVVSGIVQAARRHSTRVAVLSGDADLAGDLWREAGIADLETARPDSMSPAEAMDQAAPLLADAAERLAARLRAESR